MTPDERMLLTRFLGDLAQARGGLKDQEADALIAQAVAANPDAAYLLVQHCILADQALHAAQSRIADLEAQLRASVAPAAASFLGGAGPWGAPQAATAVPQSPPQSPPPFSPFSMGGGLGSFLRNAGTTAVGIAGGEMLFSGLSGLFGGHGGMWGGGYGGYGQPVENVTVNEYGDNGGGNDGGDSGGGSGDY